MPSMMSGGEGYHKRSAIHGRFVLSQDFSTGDFSGEKLVKVFDVGSVNLRRLPTEVSGLDLE